MQSGERRWTRDQYSVWPVPVMDSGPTAGNLYSWGQLFEAWLQEGLPYLRCLAFVPFWVSNSRVYFLPLGSPSQPHPNHTATSLLFCALSFSGLSSHYPHSVWSLMPSEPNWEGLHLGCIQFHRPFFSCRQSPFTQEKCHPLRQRQPVATFCPD
jgi:hypothetical protein